MTIILTFIATVASFAFIAILANIQYDTSYLARWSFGLWLGTLIIVLWWGALYTGGFTTWPNR